MYSLSNDKSKCTGSKCPKKEKCLRYMGEHENHEQSSIFSPFSCIIKEDGAKEWSFKMFIPIDG